MKWNKLLHRQIQKHFGPEKDLPENIQRLLNEISDSYNHYEKDRKMLEHSIDLSSNEMVELNESLRTEASELRNAHTELSRLLNNINDGFFSIDTSTYQYIFISAACEKIYGYTPEEFRKTPLLWKEVILPEDTHLADPYDPRLAAGQRLKMQYRIKNKSGNIRWLKVRIVPTLGDKGQLIRIDAVINDITDRKLAEINLQEAHRELQQLFANSEDVLFSVDMTTYKLTQMSPSCLKVYGYTADEFLNSRDLWSSVIHPDDKNVLDSHFEDLYTGKKVYNQYRIIHRDGSVRWVDNIVVPTTNTAGNLLRLDGITRDVTQRKWAEDEIRSLNQSLEIKVKQRTEELEETNKELESFSYTVSHDLRAPLRITTGFAQILKATAYNKLTEDEQGHLDVIMSSAQKMSQLIDDLLNFSRLGKAPVAKEVVPMSELAKVAIKESQIMFADAKATVNLSEIPDAIGDGGLLKQVWANLISNALKYSSKKDEPKIEVGTLNCNGEIAYFVKDNGAGFDMSCANKLFGVFQRLHKLSDYEGSGVGLALVHRIITKHGGRIWAEAQENKGATFYFTLPQPISSTQSN